MRKKKILSIMLSVSMFLGTVGTTITSYADVNGQFKNALGTIQKKQYSSEKFTAKPLVILMDFPDYKYTELDKREDFRINNFKGSETTAKFYEELFFGDNTYKTSDGKEHITVNKFYMEESGGTYEFKGKVVGWYTAKGNAAEYGSNDNGGDQPKARNLVKEAIERAAQDLDLSEFDIEDKWDIDGDGNYNEPDGIIDSLVVIHPGLGEEWGGGSLGEDAIWPFRWGFNVFGEETDKMTAKEKQELVAKNPSVKDKTGKSYLMEDFTIFEQDLPVDLFNHEFGHVLGLPDLYGTDRISQPPVENWSIMGGSYSGNPRGSEPVSYGAYCKEFLQKDFEKRGRKSNWQNSKNINLEDITEEGIDIVLDQASLKGSNKDSVIINLPQAQDERIVTPPEGKQCYFSGKADNLENYMTTKETIDLTNAKNPKMSFKAWYKIDPYFDFASVQVKEAGTDKWITIKDETNLTTDKVDPWVIANESDGGASRNPGWGFTDYSKGWEDAVFDLTQFAGKKIEARFRLKTDGNTPEEGIYIDDLKVVDGSNTLFADNAEGESKFKFDGFKVSNGIATFNHYYMLEWRNGGAETLVDKGLNTINVNRTGLKYDAGLVLWYINGKYDGFKPDQNVVGHPGEACIGIVDANQKPVMFNYDDGSVAPAEMNYQMHDAAFSLRPGTELDFKRNIDDRPYTVKDKDTFMNPVFNDKNDYTGNYGKGLTGLKLREYGLKVFVTEESKDRSTAKIHIAREKDGSKATTQEQDLINMIKAENGKLFVTPTAQYGEKAYAEYVNAKNEKKQLTLEYKDGKYVADASFLSGKNDWNMSHIIFIDAAGNAKAVYNKEVHKIFGADLSKSGELSPVKIQITNKESEFVKNSTVNVKADVKINKTDATNADIEKIKLLVGVYDSNDKLVSFAVKEATVGKDGVTPINTNITIPNQDNLKVKIFLWESEKVLKSLNKSVTIPVK